MKGRYWFTILIVLALLATLVARAAYVLVQCEVLISEANKRSLRTEQIPYIRGDILDRNGELLSVSVKTTPLLPIRKRFSAKTH